MLKPLSTVRDVVMDQNTNSLFQLKGREVADVLVDDLSCYGATGLIVKFTDGSQLRVETGREASPFEVKVQLQERAPKGRIRVEK